MPIRGQTSSGRQNNETSQDSGRVKRERTSAQKRAIRKSDASANFTLERKAKKDGGTSGQKTKDKKVSGQDRANSAVGRDAPHHQNQTTVLVGARTY